MVFANSQADKMLRRKSLHVHTRGNLSLGNYVNQTESPYRTEYVKKFIIQASFKHHSIEITVIIKLIIDLFVYTSFSLG